MRDETLITLAGRDPKRSHGAVNTPVYHASTIAFERVAEMVEAHDRPFEPGTIVYGRFGTPTTFALEEAVATLEGGHRAIAVSSGLAAITAALGAFAKAGGHVLVADSSYGPTRSFCERGLTAGGVEATYYDPSIGSAIEALLRPNTTAIYLESPGSLTFEVQDVPAITAVARRHGIPTVIDNTWATPYFFKPFAHGIDVSVHAATKYIGGHSDLMLGIIVVNEENFDRVRRHVALLGHSAAPDDCFLALRGLRTLAVRLRRHQESALAVARWLAERPEVERVLHPALPSCPGHELWRRDFLGSSGLFSLVLRPVALERVHAMLESLELFALGYSWGGFESLAIPTDPAPLRTAASWRAQGPVVRLHIGLEDPADLLADLEQGLARLAATS